VSGQSSPDGNAGPSMALGHLCQGVVQDVRVMTGPDRLFPPQDNRPLGPGPVANSFHHWCSRLRFPSAPHGSDSAISSCSRFA
jgi:hypothetical protein